MSETSGRQDAGATPEPIATELDDISAAAAIEGTATTAEAGPAATVEGEADEPLIADELEHGIASIFAALHAASEDGAEPFAGEEQGEIDDNVTFQLLTELDRLWHRAA